MSERPRAKPRRDNVRALSRGLAVLRQVNIAGESNAVEIARATGIPRPTVYRLLETLEQEGYVALSPTSSRVRVTRLAASLGDGFALTSQLCQAAGRVFAEYVAQIVWPLDISVYENAAMVIQETTHGQSPLSIDRGMTGYRLPMLRTSAGRCYLGHCAANEREVILEHIRRLADPADAPFLEPGRLGRMLVDVARSGYASRDTAEFRAATRSVAFPVVIGGSVVGCVSMIWIHNAMTLEEALKTHEAQLRAIASRLGAMLEDGL